MTGSCLTCSSLILLTVSNTVHVLLQTLRVSRNRWQCRLAALLVVEELLPTKVSTNFIIRESFNISFV